MKKSIHIPTLYPICKISVLSALILLAIAQTGNAQCSGNTTPPTVSCLPNVQLDIKPGDSRTISASAFDDGTYDDCSPSNSLQFFIETGPPSANPPATTELEFSATQAGSHPIVFWAVDEQGNAAYCTANLDVSACTNALAMACNDLVTVTLGENYTAEIDAFTMLEGGPYCNHTEFTIRLGQTGNYVPALTLGPNNFGTHLMSVKNNANGNICWGLLEVLPGALSEDCPLLYVDLATWAIRPCFSNNKYYVTYANGFAQTIAYTYVDVVLAPGLTFESSEIPETNLGNNTYRFQTGTLAAGESGRFWIQFQADCDAPVGTTYCSTANIYPDTICPGALPWSGAEVAVEGACVDDSVRLTIRNIGVANTGLLDYVVVEDVLMRATGQFTLGPGEAMTLDPVAANGATIRLETDQEPGFPYTGRPSVAVEGCGGFTPGMVTQFPTALGDPFSARNCRESSASYDPNDKQPLPKGVGADRLIEKNTLLNYMIRFQNTGTDTAFRVVIVDTLSAHLNPATVRAGASSHPYTWDLVKGNILRFTFDNILLPDSTVNEPASQGFVQFSVAQTPDNPDGTQIENTAAIFFDFNAPVITNTTRHTIGSQIITVAIDEPAAGQLPLRVYPNPATDVVFIDLEQPLAGMTGLRFELLDALGRPVRRVQDVNLPLALPCAGLPVGAYFFRLATPDGAKQWSGTIVVR